jgi:capsular polysaccharide transport system ATP-binding protein
LIALHSISKELGKGRQRALVLDEIDLIIPERARLVILGQSGSGKTTLLNILNGSLLPTRGWVERRAVVSAPLGGLLRHGSGRPMTVRQLAHRLAKLYRADEQEVIYFVSMYTGLKDQILDVPLRTLTPTARRHLNYALHYGLPCDYYIFDSVFAPAFRGLEERFREAFRQRRETSGTILATSRPAVAKAFGGTGSILLGGKLVFFDTLREAIATFQQLQIEHPIVSRNDTLVPTSHAGAEEE